MSDIKEIIKKEYITCIQDPVHFTKKYCWIQHPTRGRIPFALYPFQEGVLNLFNKNEYNIILKSRQLGISTLVAAYSLWLMNFNKDKTIIIVCTKQDTAKNLVQKVTFMWENLPSWLREKHVEKNKLSLSLANGSRIIATSAASDSARSYAASLLVIDEAAFIDNIEETFISAQQTLATGGQCFVLSTPYGTGNWFHKTWVKAERHEEGTKFVPIKLPWHVHPERNPKWREEQDKELGPRAAAQECDCDFSTSGDTVIESSILKFYEQTYITDPVEKRGLDNNLWIWEYPDPNKVYEIIVDTSRGDGKDYSTIQVIDIEANRQVAEYRGQIDTTLLGNLAVAVATEYNDGLLIIENTGIGWSTVQSVIQRDYKNLYFSPKSDTLDFQTYMNKMNSELTVPGFNMSMKSRPLVIAKFIEHMNNQSCIIQSKRLYEELKVFLWKDGKAQAQSGYNDDLIIPFAIGIYIRDTALMFNAQGQELTKAVLSNFKSSTTYSGIYNPSSNNTDPWKMDLGNKNYEDLTWLLK
jgi:hypothetical protein